jgi:cytochrome b pre-mRNA-processing protein 3
MRWADTMILKRLLDRCRGTRKNPRPADRLYDAIVAQARQPGFYASLGVPDSLDGRFEMIALHAFLVLRRLKGQGPEDGIGPALVDRLFADMDANLREMGAGDLGVGRRVKAMASAFYGRIAAYEAGLAEGTLAEALRRNAFGTTEPSTAALDRLESYIRQSDSRLSRQPLQSFRTGRADFAPPPE